MALLTVDWVDHVVTSALPDSQPMDYVFYFHLMHIYEMYTLAYIAELFVKCHKSFIVFAVGLRYKH